MGVSLQECFFLNSETSAKNLQSCVTAPRLPSALRLPGVRRHVRSPAIFPSPKSLWKNTLAAAREVAVKLLGFFPLYK